MHKKVTDSESKKHSTHDQTLTFNVQFLVHDVIDGLLCKDKKTNSKSEKLKLMQNVFVCMCTL